MTILSILKIIAAVATIATGLVSLFAPRAIKAFTGLDAVGGRGITEIRAVLGAFFIGLGVAPLVLVAPETYQMLGLTYLCVAVVRTVSMFVDRSVVSSNIISAVVEVVLGIILLL